MLDSDDSHLISVGAEQTCEACGALCCKPLLMSGHPFGLSLKQGDVYHMAKHGYLALLDHHFTRRKGVGDVEEFIIQPHVFGYCPLLDYATNKCTIYASIPTMCNHFPYEVTPWVKNTTKNWVKQMFHTPVPAVLDMTYDISRCPLAHDQETNHPQFFRAKQEQVVQDGLARFSTGITQDKEALSKAKTIHLGFQVPELMYSGMDEKNMDNLMGFYPNIQHTYHGEEGESFISSGEAPIVGWAIPRVKSLLRGYQEFMEMEETVIAFTVVDDLILKRAAELGLQQEKHLKYVPIYRIRGVFSPTQATYTAPDLLVRVHAKHEYYHPDGTLLTGIIFAHELEHPTSYWEECWGELRDYYETTGSKPRRTRKRSRGKRQETPRKQPFKPQRRRKY